jgi:hypothetical protein
MPDPPWPELYEPLSVFDYVPLRASGRTTFRPASELPEPLDPESVVLGTFEDRRGRRLGYLRLAERHPSGRLLALQAALWIQAQTTRAGVGDATSGKLVWEPAETLALCWSAGGDEIFLVRERYERARDHPPAIITPLQQEYAYFLERWAWPDRMLMDRCTITPPTGWFDHVVASPTGGLAAVRWIEQDCAGFRLVDLGGSLRQLSAPQLEVRPNLVRGPTFSPDGRFLVLTSGNMVSEDPYERSETLGSVWIYSIETETVRQIVVQDESMRKRVPYSWDEWLGQPRFVTDQEFVVRLPGGAERHFSTMPLDGYGPLFDLE